MVVVSILEECVLIAGAGDEVLVGGDLLLRVRPAAQGQQQLDSGVALAQRGELAQVAQAGVQVQVGVEGREAERGRVQHREGVHDVSAQGGVDVRHAVLTLP